MGRALHLLLVEVDDSIAPAPQDEKHQQGDNDGEGGDANNEPSAPDGVPSATLTRVNVASVGAGGVEYCTRGHVHGTHLQQHACAKSGSSRVCASTPFPYPCFHPHT